MQLASPSFLPAAAAQPPALLKSNIALIGLMGAGKTTLGKLLAKRLDRMFYDSDVEIVRVTGVEVATIFEIEGEVAFRDREESVIAELLSKERILLSTGGGAVLREKSRANLRERACVVYLHASANTVWGRIRHHRGRPLLATSDPLGKLERLYAERDALYREAAHVVVDVSNESPSAVATRIELALTSYSSAAQAST
jgi:shikimate kinase